MRVMQQVADCQADIVLRPCSPASCKPQQEVCTLQLAHSLPCLSSACLAHAQIAKNQWRQHAPLHFARGFGFFWPRAKPRVQSFLESRPSLAST